MEKYNKKLYDKYELCQIQSIEKVDSDIKKFIDIEVEDDNTFHIFLESSDQYILTHNCDGDSITGLLMNFFSKWKELFQLGKIYKNITPLLVVKRGKKKEYIYTLKEWEEYQANNSLSGAEISYKKGLGSLSDEEYKEMIQNPKKVLLEWDENAEIQLECWFGDDSEPRKKELS